MDDLDWVFRISKPALFSPPYYPAVFSIRLTSSHPNMLSITSLLALLSVLLVSCQQVLALPIPSDRGLPTTITGAPAACTPAGHNYSTIYGRAADPCAEPKKRDTWLDGPLDYTKCMQGCDALLKAPNSTALEPFQGYASVLKNEKKASTMADQCTAGCKARYGGNGRRALSALRALRKRGMAPSVKISRDQLDWLARRSSDCAENHGFVIGQQNENGKAVAVAVPGSEADGCKYASGTWPKAGEWKDEKETLNLGIGPDRDAVYQVNAYEGSITGPDGKRYGACLPTEWNSETACGQDVGAQAKFTAYYTCWVAEDQITSPEQLLE